MSGLRYKDAGVDITTGNETMKRIKTHVTNTFTTHVLNGLGSFGSLYSLKEMLNMYDHPVLVQSIDGVGTKTKVAVRCGTFEHLGYDLFSATTNDIVVMGAKPITFLNYVAHDRLDSDVMEQLVQGMSKACVECGVSLVGGETAEMPGVYVTNEIDMVGVISGIVEKEKIITGETIKAGDMVFGLTSSGLHTNGYSFARKVFFEIAGNHPDDTYPELNGVTIRDALLEPHINYTNIIRDYLDAGLEIKGMAHITGGGVIENIPRILPEGLGVRITKDTWDILPIFKVMQILGNISEFEMYRTFNMGIGMVIIADGHIESSLQNLGKRYPYINIKTIGVVDDSISTVEIV